MRNERRVLRNTAVLTFGEALGQFANLLFVAAFARTYGVVEMGHYSLAMAIGAVVGLGVGLGSHNFLVRELAHTPGLAGPRVAALAPLQLLSALLIGAVTALVLWGREAGFAVMMAAIGYQLFYRTASLYYLPFRAMERMVVPVASDFAQRLLTLAVGGALMLAGAAAEVTALAMLSSVILFGLFGRWYLQRTIGPLPRAVPGEALHVLRSSWPFFGTMVLAVLYARGAPILLGLIRGAESVGGYAAADRLVVVATLMPVMYGNAAMPALSRIARRDPAQVQPLATRLLRIMLLVALPIAGGLAAFAPDIIGLVFGPTYTASILLLQILAFTMPIQATDQLLAAQLSATGHQHLLVRTRAISLTCFAVLGTTFVHFFGAPGLAVAVVLGSSVQLGGCIYHLARRGQLPLTWPAILGPAFAMSLAVGVVFWQAQAPLVVRVPLFVGALVAGVLVTGAVRRHDIDFLKAMFRREPESGPAA